MLAVLELSENMLGPHVAGLHLGLNLPYVTTPKGLLISKPAMAEPARIWTPDDIAWSPTSFASGHNERDEVLGPMSGKYCADLRQVVRRKTRTVTAGPVSFGSDHPIVRQTMGAAARSNAPPGHSARRAPGGSGRLDAPSGEELPCHQSLGRCGCSSQPPAKSPLPLPCAARASRASIPAF